MEIEGRFLKMSAELSNPVNYFLTLDNQKIHMNELIGKQILFTYTNEIHCIRCGRLTNKSFHQGYCFPCFRTSPETDDCILRPEMCKAHEGISRDMEWSKNHCLQDHVVYLAVSSGLKVGITRFSQIPTRWIDQGASHAIKIAQVPNRNMAGLLEVNLKAHFADKTNWRNMLSNKLDKDIDLNKEKEKAKSLVKKDFLKFFIDDNNITNITYPVLEYPEKVSSVSFDKENTFNGTLIGIKGQYLIFDEGKVLNIRKHNGYDVKMEY